MNRQRRQLGKDAEHIWTAHGVAVRRGDKELAAALARFGEGLNEEIAAIDSAAAGEGR
jgi:hypothetical protein